MIGNSWEWAADWFGAFTTNAVTDPHGPARGHCRVAKGGGWSSRTRYLSSSTRDGDDPADIPDTRGFRVLCEAER